LSIAIYVALHHIAFHLIAESIVTFLQPPTDDTKKSNSMTHNANANASPVFFTDLRKKNNEITDHRNTKPL
jgi:hypothetical protein